MESHLAWPKWAEIGGHDVFFIVREIIIFLFESLCIFNSVSITVSQCHYSCVVLSSTALLKQEELSRCNCYFSLRRQEEPISVVCDDWLSFFFFYSKRWGRFPFICQIPILVINVLKCLHFLNQLSLRKKTSWDWRSME